MSKFHSYSWGNVLLIRLQCPHASMVAGYGDWKTKHGRQVKRGEKGITILAPCPYYKREAVGPADPEEPGEEQQDLVQKLGFRTVTVFDISQTEGKPVPRLGVPQLAGDVAGYEALLAKLKAVSPVPVEMGALPPGTHGVYRHLEQTITLSPGMGQLQTVKTLIHEIAHAKLHALPVADGVIAGRHEKDRTTREVEAESVAYVVCQYLGLDTSDYSFGYIAGWSRGRDTAQLRASLDCIRGASAGLIDALDPPERTRGAPEQTRQRSRGRPRPRGRPSPAR